jgi:CO dehydrogenase/acetyl-CoA synthase epsilon subunit
VFSPESRIIKAQENVHRFDLISSQLLFTDRVVFHNKQVSSVCKEFCVISHISIDEFHPTAASKNF